MGTFANPLAAYCCWLISGWKGKLRVSHLFNYKRTSEILSSFTKCIPLNKWVLMYNTSAKYASWKKPNWSIVKNIFHLQCYINEQCTEKPMKYRLNAGQKQNMITFISDTALLKCNIMEWKHPKSQMLGLRKSPCSSSVSFIRP